MRLFKKKIFRKKTGTERFCVPENGFMPSGL